MPVPLGSNLDRNAAIVGVDADIHLTIDCPNKRFEAASKLRDPGLERRSQLLI